MADFHMALTSDENADLLPSSTLRLLDKLASMLNGYQLSCAQVLHRMCQFSALHSKHNHLRCRMDSLHMPLHAY